MDGAILGIAAVIALGAVAAFVTLTVVPLLRRLERMSAEAERVLRRLNEDLPPLLQQATQSLKHLDGTLVEHLPNLVARTTGTLQTLDGSLATELPGLIRETTHTVRRLSDKATG